MSGHGERGFDGHYYRRFFKNYSKREFEMYCRWSEGWLRFLDKYVDIGRGNGKRVLELGASLGYFSKVFRDRGFKVQITDVSPYIIKKAKKFQKDASFSVENIEKGINTAGQFDVIFAFEVLEHLKDPKSALANVRKKLKNGGVFIFSTPFPTRRSLADPTHINVHEESWWKTLAKKEKYKVVKIIHATFIPYLYRVSSLFSIGFPVKTDIPFVNSTVFFVLKK